MDGERRGGGGGVRTNITLEKRDERPERGNRRDEGL